MAETLEKEPQVKDEDGLTKEKLNEIRQTTDWDQIQPELEKYPDWKKAIDKLYEEAEKLATGLIRRDMKLKEVTTIVSNNVGGNTAERFYQEVRKFLEQTDSPGI